MRSFEIKPATLADVPVLLENFRQGIETYRSFAPPGWEGFEMERERARIEERLQLSDVWCRLAHDGGEPAGHVGLLAAREQNGGHLLIPGLAHLWMLFIREPWWGTGLARHLLGLALAEAAGRGFERIRLVTPAGQARARAFYEREGFATHGEPELEPRLGLELIEYQREL